MTDILEGGQKDTMRSDAAGAKTNWALTNLTANYAADLNNINAQNAGDVVGTLIRDLILLGVIHGTVATH